MVPLKQLNVYPTEWPVKVHLKKTFLQLYISKSMYRGTHYQKHDNETVNKLTIKKQVM